VADTAISVGVCFLAFHLAFDKPEPQPALQQDRL
jgi:lipoprotein signal peptidase